MTDPRIRQLGQDLANVEIGGDADAALSALREALIGEHEPVKSMGIIIQRKLGLWERWLWRLRGWWRP